MKRGRLFEAEYRQYVSKQRERARLILKEKYTPEQLKRYERMRQVLGYADFVEQCNPGLQYDPQVLSTRRDAYTQETREIKQKKLEASEAYLRPEE